MNRKERKANYQLKLDKIVDKLINTMYDTIEGFGDMPYESWMTKQLNTACAQRALQLELELPACERKTVLDAYNKFLAKIKAKAETIDDKELIA